MKYLILTFLLIFASCAKHEDKETVEPYDQVKEKAASYLSQLAAYSDQELFPDRCDSLTFKSLAAAFAAPFDVAAHEYSPGEWHRDTVPCYPDDSRSEVSFDNLIGVLHKAWTSNDRTKIVQLADYGRENNWKFGDGPAEYTVLPQIGVITDDMLGHMSLASERSIYALESTHNSHIIALSALLKLRYAAFLETHDMTILRNLKSNMLIRSILARATDGSQAEAIYYLSQFPETLPLETGIESWGSAPSWLYFFLVKGIIDGK